jgi:hypothetical protein
VLKLLQKGVWTYLNYAMSPIPPRANSQLGKLEGKYGPGVTAEVTKSGIPGRAAALQEERSAVANARARGEELPEQQRPQ